MTRGTIDDVLLYARSTDVEQAEAWLNAANVVVTSKLGASSLDADTLAAIENHMAAHFMEVGGGQAVSSERLGSWAVSYATGAGAASLNSTRNGLIAQLLDTTGTLAESHKPKPSFAVLGPTAA